jgi:hypothetical protein
VKAFATPSGIKNISADGAEQFDAPGFARPFAKE